MSLKIKIIDEKTSKSIQAFEALVEYEVRTKLLSEVVRSEMMSLRSGNAHTKTRSEVRGGGKKPWKQKGTGRARHGSTRSPLWVGGGVTFGPRNTTNWSRKINKSARLSALKSILKDRLVDNQVYLFSDTNYPKTRNAIDILNTVSKKTGYTAKNIIILYTNDEKTGLSGFVSSEAKLMNAANLKIVNLVNSKSFILTPKAKILLENRVSN